MPAIDDLMLEVERVASLRNDDVVKTITDRLETCCFYHRNNSKIAKLQKQRNKRHSCKLIQLRDEYTKMLEVPHQKRAAQIWFEDNKHKLNDNLEESLRLQKEITSLMYALSGQFPCGKCLACRNIAEFKKMPRNRRFRARRK